MKRLLLLASIASFLSVNAQTERLTFLNYNMMYYRAPSTPCTHTVTPSQRDQYLKSIVKYVNPDIFTVNELGATPANAGFVRDFVLNTDGITYYAAAGYSNQPGNPSSIVNMLFYNTGKLSLYSQFAIEKEITGNDLVRVVDVYRLYYKDPKLALGADTVFFTVISAHLKAGQNSADAAERTRAAEAVMNYVDFALNDNNVILAGDLNLYSGSEGAFQKFINYPDVSERFRDPVNQNGNWNNNSTYAAIHTQSTHSSPSGCFSGGGMDDRFDFFLVSDEIISGSEKVKYVPNSYQAMGQDGNHFNQSVNSGTNTAVPSSIADALYNFSDHLPIVMQVDVTMSDLKTGEKVRLDQNLAYTNPIGAELVIRLNSVWTKDVGIKVLDLTGKVVINTHLEKGMSRKEILTDKLSPGIYLLNIDDSSGNSFTKKIIKN